VIQVDSGQKVGVGLPLPLTACSTVCFVTVAAREPEIPLKVNSFMTRRLYAGRRRNSKSILWRIGFALVTLLLTPIFLPVGTIFVFLHALKQPAKPHRHDDGHEHKPDGSCCGR
jgi:hypothetical protein